MTLTKKTEEGSRPDVCTRSFFKVEPLCLAALGSPGSQATPVAPG